MSSYMIDFDKWLVHARHADANLLNQYGEDNNLLGMEIVSNAEELCLILDVDEMTKIYGNLTHTKETFLDEEEVAGTLWVAMEEHGNDIPELDNGKLIPIESDELDDWDEPEPVTHTIVTPLKVAKKKGVRAKDLIGKTFSLGNKTPRKGTTFAILTDFIESNMDEATFDELTAEFIDKYEPSGKTVCDEKFASGYIRGAFNAEYIEESL